MRAPTEDSITWGTDKSYAKKCDGSCRGGGGNMHSKFYAFSHTGTAHNVVIVSSSNLNFGGAHAGVERHVHHDEPSEELRRSTSRSTAR